MLSLATKRILLIIGGGVAAYKALELIRLLQKQGAQVRAVLTPAGAEFVTPLAVSALTQSQTYMNLFSLLEETEMGHIRLSRDADLIVVAPATADLMAKTVAGLAPDLASTVLLASSIPVLMAPAMNVRMWQHPSTQRNVTRLRLDGVHVSGPDTGDMACGEYGPGRMAEPSQIVEDVVRLLAGRGRLCGRRVIITSGPTQEALDPVRYLSNHSSGRQGHALAQAAVQAGAEVILVSGPVCVPDPSGCEVRPVISAVQMMEAVEAALPADVFIGCAAVCDWQARSAASHKLKKGDADTLHLDLVRTPDILSTLARSPHRPGLVIGFAAETNDLAVHARRKLLDKGCDWIVANDVSGDVMGGETNQILLLRRLATGEISEEPWPQLSKQEVALRLIAAVADGLEVT